jgi:hypothetical protein
VVEEGGVVRVRVADASGVVVDVDGGEEGCQEGGM